VYIQLSQIKKSKLNAHPEVIKHYRQAFLENWEKAVPLEKLDYMLFQES
jgi:hypothetical protein